ncbi:MAG: ABC transporter substrate-binding protein [Alphaproteobacteria bacterium]|nr:ABC transporter substrate-binding protein [Alphaproteobacteria bacterium]
MSTFERLQRDFTEGRISRRSFINRAAAMGALAAVPAGLLAESAKAEAPQSGGHLRVATVQGSTTDNLDPATLSSGFVNMLWYTAYSQLTEVNAEGQLEPLLAESYEAVDGPDKWVFTLRKDAEFHNGKTVDSNDVIQSIARAQGEDSSSAMAFFVNTITDMQADGSDKVIFTLAEGNADFPFGLSARALSIMPANGDEVDVSGVGAGAYIIKSFEPGISAELERNPNFFMSGRAHVASTELLCIPDATSRQNGLLSGAIDVTGDIDPKTANLMAEQAGITVEDTGGTQHYTFPMRGDLAPFDDNNIRMALKLAVDRELILDKVLDGHGSLGNDHPISPANRFYNDELPQREYDPDKANWYLRQAGIDSIDLELVASDGLYAGAVDTTVLMAESAAAAGINITPVRAPADGYWSDVWLVAPWSGSYWSGRPTEDWMFSQGYAAESSWNESYWQNERFNQLLVEARGELDIDKRRDMYFEMQAICRDDCPSVIHLYANHITAYRDGVRHPEHVAGNWEFDGYKLIERWWLDQGEA